MLPPSWICSRGKLWTSSKHPLTAGVSAWIAYGGSVSTPSLLRSRDFVCRMRFEFLVWHRRDEAAKYGAANTIDRRGGFMLVRDPQVTAGFRWIHTWMPTGGPFFKCGPFPQSSRKLGQDFVQPCPACSGSPQRWSGGLARCSGGSCRTVGEGKIWDDFGPDKELEDDDWAVTMKQGRSCTCCCAHK